MSTGRSEHVPRSTTPKSTLSPVKRIVLSALVLALFFLVLEAGTRLLGERKELSPNPRNAITIPDDVLNHRWASNVSIFYPFHGFEYRLITNAQGWIEERDVAVEKPPGTVRIFFIGDSNVQGLVNRDDKMVEIVESQLNERDPTIEQRFEVINTGTTSYSMLLYYLLIKTVILDYDPDLVVINVDMTDVANDSHYRRLALVDESGELIAVLPASHAARHRYRMTPFGTLERSTTARLRDWLVETSAFANWFDRATRRFQAKQPPRVNPAKNEDHWLAMEWSDDTRENVRFSMQYLARSVELLQENGVPVYVTGVPHFPQFEGAWSSAPHQVLGETVRKAGGLYLNSFEALAPRVRGSRQDDFYWDSDPTHFNVAGNRIWARAHLEFIERECRTLLPLLACDPEGS